MDFEQRCREWEGGYHKGVKTALVLIQAEMEDYHDGATYEMLMRLYANVGAYLER